MSKFTGFCARGHDRIDFTDPTAFEGHFRTEHGRRKIGAGNAHPWTHNRPAPMKTAKPHPWRPARPDPKALDAWVASGELEMTTI